MQNIQELAKPQGIIVLSGPSAVGKSTLLALLLNTFLNAVASVSWTTREPRLKNDGQMEKDGVDYKFVTRQQFHEKVAEGGFLEFAEVHGNWYGTLFSQVDTWLKFGHSVLLDIDVQGFEQIRKRAESEVWIKNNLISFFIDAEEEEYQRRVWERAQKNKTPRVVVETRLRNAAEERKQIPKYDYLIINQDRETAFQKIAEISEARFALSRR